MASIKTPLLILGDFNFADINWVTKLGNNVNSNKLVGTMNDLFLEQLVNTPTREISNNILDLILNNSPEVVQNINVLESLGNSDHNIIMFNITMNKNVINNIKVPNFNRGDYNKLREKVSIINWKNIFKEKNTYEMWETFKEIIEGFQRECIPVKTLRSSKNKPLWWNNEINEKIKLKRKYF